MNSYSEEEKLIRWYLLGAVSPEEEEQVEQISQQDEEFGERLLLAEEDLIDDYARGQMPEGERDLFEQNFLTTPERRKKLVMAQAAVKYAEAVGNSKANQLARSDEMIESRRTPQVPSTTPPDKTVIESNRKWWQTLFAPVWKIAVYAVLILSIGFGSWWMVFRQSELGEAQIALRDAYRGWRTHETRVTGFDYAPLDQTRDAKQEDAGYTAREHAEILIRSLERKKSNPASLHLLGQMYLAEKEYEKAITQLRAAQTGEPNNAPICSDLGAALLEKARRIRVDDPLGDRMAVAGESLNFLTKATELDGSLNQALFNRALCFELLENFPKAKDDWDRYLKRDSTSSWADEARTHLGRINKRENRISSSQSEIRAIFEKAVQAGDEHEAWRAFSLGRVPTGNLVVESLIDELLAAVEQQDVAGFQRRLYSLNFASDLDLKNAGDRFTKTLTRYYKTSARSGLLASAQARMLMKQGHARRAKSVNEAIELYKEAGQIFRQAGNLGEAEFADFHIGKNLIWASKLDEALDLLERLSRTAQGQDFWWLQSQSIGQLASVHFTRNEFSRSLDCSQQLLKIAEKMGDRDAEADCSVTIADLHYYLGDYRTALNYLDRSLLRTEGDMQPQTRWRSYQEIALCFASLGLFSAALEYQTQALLLAEQINVPVITARTRTFLGWIYTKLGNYQEGIKNIQEAVQIGERNQKDPVGENIIAYSSLRLGNLYRLTKQFNEAVVCYDKQVVLAKKLKLPFDSYEAQQGKFLVFSKQQNIGAAQEAMQQSLALLEKYRGEIVQEGIRNRFFDTGQDVYDAAIQFAYESLGSPQQAFDYSEISRARSLLDSLAKPVARPLTLAEVRSRMPKDTQIIQYAVLDEALMIWVVTPDDPTGKLGHVRQQISSNTIDEKVRRYLQLLGQRPTSSQSAPRQEAEELYNLLIKPVRGLLRTDRQICIVPDKSLCYLPFNALLSSETGKYLLEEFAIGTAPSASTFVACSEIAVMKGKVQKETVLVVGDPKFDNKLFPQLDPLDSAREEARQVAAYYPFSRVLIGGEATESRVKAAMVEADVIHIAAHGLTDERSALSSALVLAADPNSANESEADGLLHAYEIYGMPLSRTRLVVLSACRSGIESFHRGEGMIGLARPFLAAGVPQVISSQWKVDSIATRDLMIHFHKYRKQAGISTVQALRRAQEGFLQDKQSGYRHPYFWAAFSVVGGSAKAKTGNFKEG